MLWRDDLPATWEKALRVLMTKLRALLEECGIDGSSALTSAFGCYKLALSADAWIDVDAAVEALERAEAELAVGDVAEARSQATTAAALARRSFLPGEEGAWVEEKRRDLRDVLVRALECLRDASFGAEEFADAVRHAEQVTELEPFREDAYRRLMQSHASAGNPAEALRVYERCRRLLADELGTYPSPETETAYLEILRAGPASANELGLEPTKTVEVVNPYKGLRAFEETDADDFFGREALTERLVARVEETRFLAVVGPSGSGKSSVVRAGLVPALRKGALPGSEKWHVVELVPGAYPVEELEAALLRIAVNPPASLLEQLEADERGLLRAVKRVLPGDRSELVLVVDQLEEVFTLVDDEQRRAQFLALVETAVRDPHARLRVVATLRADFYDRPLLYRGFAELLRDHVEVVLPLAADEYERAIRCPAERVDVALEEGLVSEIVADVANAPGALPLLEYALTELLERRDGRLLTRAAYRELGGVSGALAGRADELYLALDEAGREAARQLFLRLVTLGEGTDDARRRVARTELTSLAIDQAALAAAIDAFGASRLLSFDRDPRTGAPTVEVAHEALLREWSRLRHWIDAAREDVRMHRRLAAAAAEWDESGREPSFLLRGSQLDQSAAWAAGAGLVPTAVEQEYMAAGLEQKLAEERAEQERVAQKLRQNRRLRLAVAIVTAALAAAVVAGLLAFRAQGREADARAVADAGRLGALALLEDDLDRALLLAREGVALNDSLESRGRLLAALLRSPAAIAIDHLDGDAVRWLDASPDGERVAAGFGNGTVALLDVRRRRQDGSVIAVAPLDVSSVDFSPDGSRLAISSLSGRVGVWDANSRALRFVLRRPTDLLAATVTFAPDGRTLAGLFVEEKAYFDPVPGRAVVVLWDAATGEPRGRPVEVSRRGGDFMHYTRDGRRLLVVNHAGVTVVDARTLRRIRTFAHGGPPRFFSIAASPTNGDLVALLRGDEGTVEFLDLATGKRRRASGATHRLGARAVFSPDGLTLATSGPDSRVIVWDVPSGRARETLTGHTGSVEGLAFSPDGRTLFSGAGSSVIAWDLEGSRRLGRPFRVSPPNLNPPNLIGFAFSPDGSTIAAASGGGGERISLLDVSTLRPRSRPLSPGVGPITTIRFSPDGRTLAVGGKAAGAALIDAASGRVIRVLRGGHAGGIASIQFSPDARRVITGGRADGRALVWDRRTGRRVRVLREPAGEAVFVEWSPDGSMVATAGGGGRLVAWRVADWTRAGEFRADPTYAGPADFSPDGSTIAGGGVGGIAHVWDVERAREVGRSLIHPGWVNSIEFDRRGAMLVTSSTDGNVRLWDVALQRQIGPVLPGSGFGNRAAFMPDGKSVVVGYETGDALVWDVDVERWKARACAIAGRSLTKQEWAEFLPDRAYEPSCA